MSRMATRGIKTSTKQQMLQYKETRNKPKRLFMLRKSKHMKRWLVQNPWIRPMCVFNYATVQIQKLFRGVLSRCEKESSRHQKKFVDKKKSNRQLDKYLVYLDRFRVTGRIKPAWLDAGFSSWCAVRLQAWVRMFGPRRKFLYSKQLVCQVATIVIQTAWHNYRFQRVRSYHPKKLTDFLAVQSIQLAWRSYSNRRIYFYFRDLITVKLKGLPADLLRSIIPNESILLDKAAGVHVRFRLGGSVFPPKVYFKIYTHRGLCDVNSFAPRDYKNEAKLHADQTHTQMIHWDGSGISTRQSTKLKVGQRYFDAVVNTTSDMNDWYKRDEQNNWRAIASKLFEGISLPPWHIQNDPTSKPKPFHFSRLRRKADIEKQRRIKKKEWMQKMYTLNMNTVAGSKSPSAPRSQSPDQNKMVEYLHSPADAQDYNYFVDEVMASVHSSKKLGEIRNNLPVADDTKHSTRTMPCSDAKLRPGSRPGGEGKRVYDAVNNTSNIDLLSWSMALDYDEYCSGWGNLGVTLPSDANNAALYKLNSRAAANK